MYRFIYLVFAIFILGTINISYSSPVQQEELTPEMAKKIPPVPPVGLAATYTCKGVELSWKRHSLESVTSYEIYRWRKNKSTRIVTTRSLDFFDKKGRRNDGYTVKAINSYETRSPHSPKISAITNCK